MKDLLKRLRTRLTKRECFCQNLAYGIVLFYDIFMLFVFPESWVDTPQSIALINVMYPIVPMLRLMLHSPLYTNFWGLFYSVFWLHIWIFPVLGFMQMTGFFIDKPRIDLVKRLSYAAMMMLEIFFVMLCLVLFELPVIRGHLWFDELSNNFLFLLPTTFTIAISYYLGGLLLGALRAKYLLRNDQPEI